MTTDNLAQLQPKLKSDSQNKQDLIQGLKFPYNLSAKVKHIQQGSPPHGQPSSSLNSSILKQLFFILS